MEIINYYRIGNTLWIKSIKIFTVIIIFRWNRLYLELEAWTLTFYLKC